MFSALDGLAGSEPPGGQPASQGRAVQGYWCEGLIEAVIGGCLSDIIYSMAEQHQL